MTDTAAPLRRDIRLLGSILGQVLVEQEGPELLETVESVRRSSAGGAPRRLGRSDRGRPDRRAAGAGAARIRALLPARQPRRAAAPRASAARRRAPRPRSARVAERCVQARRAGGPRRGARQLDPPRPYVTSNRGDTANRAAHAPADRARAAATRRARGLAGRDRCGRGADRRRDHAPLAGGRGPPRPTADHRRDPPRPVVLRAQPHGRCDRSPRKLARAPPGRAAAARVRLVDRRRHGRQPGCGRGLDRRGTRACPRTGTGPVSRRGSHACRRGRLGPLARAGLRRARGVDRTRRGRAPELRGRDRVTQRARALPPQALVHVVAARQRELPRT